MRDGRGDRAVDVRLPGALPGDGDPVVAALAVRRPGGAEVADRYGVRRVQAVVDRHLGAGGAGGHQDGVRIGVVRMAGVPRQMPPRHGAQHRSAGVEVAPQSAQCRRRGRAVRLGEGDAGPAQRRGRPRVGVVLGHDRHHRRQAGVLEHRVHEPDAAGQAAHHGLGEPPVEQAGDEHAPAVVPGLRRGCRDVASRGAVGLAGAGHPRAYQPLEVSVLGHGEYPAGAAHATSSTPGGGPTPA